MLSHPHIFMSLNKWAMIGASVAMFQWYKYGTPPLDKFHWSSNQPVSFPNQKIVLKHRTIMGLIILESIVFCFNRHRKIVNSKILIFLTGLCSSSGKHIWRVVDGCFLSFLLLHVHSGLSEVRHGLKSAFASDSSWRNSGFDCCEQSTRRAVKAVGIVTLWYHIWKWKFKKTTWHCVLSCCIYNKAVLKRLCLCHGNGLKLWFGDACR